MSSMVWASEMEENEENENTTKSVVSTCLHIFDSYELYVESEYEEESSLCIYENSRTYISVQWEIPQSYVSVALSLINVALPLTHNSTMLCNVSLSKEGNQHPT